MLSDIIQERCKTVSIIEYQLYACWLKNVNNTFKPRECSTLKYINKKRSRPPVSKSALFFIIISCRKIYRCCSLPCPSPRGCAG